MSQNVIPLESWHRQRTRALVVPREHGAWGMLLIPLLTGAVVGLLRGGISWPLPAFITTALALFCMRMPVESLLGTSPLRAQSRAERTTLLRSILLLGVVAALGLGILLWGGRNLGLVAIGASSALAFALQAGLKKLGRGTRMASQIIGAIVLTSTAPAAYYLATGRFDLTASVLWATNWLFAADQIHFVQLRIHCARATRADKWVRGRTFLLLQAAAGLLLMTLWRTGLVPGLVLLAFVPVLLRAVFWFLSEPGPLAVRRLGWTELAHAVTFGVLLVCALQLPS